jgi:hypothetical protein
MTDVAQQTSGSNDASHLSDPYDEAVGHVLAEEQGSLRLPLEPISPSSSATPDAVSPSLALPFFAPEAEGQATAPYIAAARDVLDEDDFQRRVTIYQALEVTPGRSAGAARIGQMFGGIPAPIVEENLDEYRRAADYYDVLDKVRMSPALSELGQDPDYLYRVAGDITTFSDFDASFGQAAIQQGLQPKQSVGAKILDGVTRFADGSIGSIRALAAAPFSGSAALWNLMRSPADLVGANGLSDFFKHEAEVSAQTAADVRGDQSHATPLQRTIYQALEGAGVAILTLPASAITGNPAPTLAVMSAMTAGQSYDEAIAQGLSPLEATLYAGGQAMTDYIAGRIPLAKLVRSVKVSSPFFKTVVGQFVLQSGNDQIARHWQDFNSWMALHPEKTFDDYLKERPNAAFEAFIAGATASFMQTTGAYAIDGGIAKAKAGAASIREWLDVARKAKGQNSDPAQLAADLQRLAEAHNIGEVHIAAPELMQALQQAGDYGQAILSQLPSLAGQLPEALATGGDLQIPTGELLTAVSGSHAEEALVQHLRIDPAAPSLAQAGQSGGDTTALSQPAAQDRTTGEALSEDQGRKPDWHEVFEDLKIPEGLREPPSVVSNSTVNGVAYADTNQQARPANRARRDHETVVADRVKAKYDRDRKRGKSNDYPNGNMADAHAEIADIQKAYEDGNTQDRDMETKVLGEDVCGYCKGDIPAAAHKAGLRSLTIDAIEKNTGKPIVYYWKPGMRTLGIRE